MIEFCMFTLLILNITDQDKHFQRAIEKYFRT